jgi:hypothetical protein
LGGKRRGLSWLIGWVLGGKRRGEESGGLVGFRGNEEVLKIEGWVERMRKEKKRVKV